MNGQNYLPETARQTEMLAIRICDVDEEAKANIVYACWGRGKGGGCHFILYHLYMNSRAASLFAIDSCF